jgi:hypothetical protein
MGDLLMAITNKITKFLTWEDFTQYAAGYNIILSDEWTATITSGLPTFVTFLDSDGIMKGRATFPNADATFLFSAPTGRQIAGNDNLRRGPNAAFKVKFTVLPTAGQYAVFSFGVGYQFRVDSNGTLERLNNTTWQAKILNLFADGEEHEIFIYKNPTTDDGTITQFWAIVDKTEWLGVATVNSNSRGFEDFRIKPFSGAATFTCEISIIYVQDASYGFQTTRFVNRGTRYSDPGFYFLTKFVTRIPPFHLSDGTMYGIDRTTKELFIMNAISTAMNPKFDRWQKIVPAFTVVDTIHYIFALGRFQLYPTQEALLIYRGYTGGSSTFQSGVPSVAGERCIEIFCPEGTLDFYGLFVPATSPANQIILRRLSVIIPSLTWTIIQTYTLSPSFTWDVNYPFPIWGFFNKNDSYYYFVANNLANNNYATWYRINFTTSTLSALYNFPTGYKLSQNNEWPIMADNVKGDGVFVILYNSGGANYKTYYSTAFNTASFSEFSSYPIKFAPPRDFPFYSQDRYWRVGPYYGANWRRLAIEAQNPAKPYFWAEYINHLLKIKNPVDTFASVHWVSGFGLVLENNVDEDLWHFRLEPDEDFSAVELEKSASQIPTTAKVSVNPDTAELLADGSFVEMYDGFENLMFIGKIVNPISINEQKIVQINLVGTDYDLYRKIPLDAKVVTSKSILQTLIDGCDFIYQNVSIDSNGDFTTTYNRKINTPLDKLVYFMRILERALFYTEPDGKITCLKYTRAVSTGIFWSHRTPDIYVKSYQEVDLQITRTEVSGGTNLAGQVRRIFIGDTTYETQFGIFAIQYNDPAIMNDPECLQYATNLFGIAANNIGGGRRGTKIIRLLTKNQGYLQPGMTIKFIWNDNVYSIPYGTYTIMELTPYKADLDICEIVLTDGILTTKEFQSLARSGKRDDELTGTYYDADKVSAATSTPVTQNAVSRLRAGTYIWRVPEPLAFDFTKTALPVGAGAWATLDLAAIIPEGVRSVHIRTQYKSSSSASYFLYRKFGNTGNIQGVGDSVDNTGKDHEGFSVVGVSEDRKIDVYSSITQANWTTWNMVIVGWDI